MNYSPVPLESDVRSMLDRLDARADRLIDESATLRQTLIDVTGQRDQAQRRADALQAELDRVLRERAA